MGKRDRKRRQGGGGPAGGAGSFADLGLDLTLDAAEVALEPTAAHAVGEGELELRTALSPGTRAEYAALLRGDRSSAAAAREDVWQRAVEFLYERLAVRWTVAGVATTGQPALLARFRAATRDERTAIRAALRTHLTSHFPDLTAP